MGEQPEQIGDMRFVPNPEYPYPFPVEPPPHFWMTEQTGRLEAAVERYFSGERLAPDELERIRVYLQQYVERAVIAGDVSRATLLGRIAGLRSTRDIERFADDLADAGIEPF